MKPTRSRASLFVGCLAGCATLLSCTNNPDSVGGNAGGSVSFAIGGQGGAGNPGSSAGGYPGIHIDVDAALGAQGLGGQGGAAPPTEEVNCGIQKVSTTKLPADLLLVLDRSNSMAWDITQDQACPNGSTTCTTRWTAMTDAVNAVLPATQDTVNWGLKLFATSFNGCDVSDGVDVAPGPNNASKVSGAIAAATPSTGTPTTLVIQKTGAYMAGLADANPKYILLATDGQPYCGGRNKDQPDDANAIASIQNNAAAKGVKVFVVGIAINDATKQTLDQMASAGGTDHFYPVDSPDALKTALQDISGIVATCSFKLTGGNSASDPSNIAVFLDGNRLPDDPNNGWVLTNNNTEVDVTGSYCDSIKNGDAKEVQVLIGCAPIPPGTIW